MSVSEQNLAQQRLWEIQRFKIWHLNRIQYSGVSLIVLVVLRILLSSLARWLSLQMAFLKLLIEETQFGTLLIALILFSLRVRKRVRC